MSAESADGDRTEAATPHRLREARERGSVARSTDLQSFAAIAMATIGLFALASDAVRALARLAAKLMKPAPEAFADTSAAASLLTAALVDALAVLAPLLFIVVATTLLVGVLQTGGLLFSATPVTPDLDRVNPVSGLKRIFNLKLLYETVKSLLKLSALALVSWAVVVDDLRGALSMVYASPREFVDAAIASGASLWAKLLVVLGLFAIVDVVFTRWDFHRSLRMSRREQTEEHKRMEGDPRIKSRIRELRQQYFQRVRAVARVPEASVLITNPTHVAVALKYQHGVSIAPEVVAKGAGALAARMRQCAHRSRIPVVQSPELARALFKEVPQDALLPEAWYPQVARILVWVQAMQRARAAAYPGGTT